ncbi:uncharacterized protein LOC121386582 isoform X2 [Gigantopelta aegis]|uniref:uncharacterized protein LOC121386582 isoform X2 n=1 Tax=Gigantopelta aegis TaxID=1735272 RepID=UPI001B88D1F6|nr:uncharacterized protein LOC121386582 isoform X2 [Gigantopelta aegis]
MAFSQIIFEVILTIALIRDNSVEGVASATLNCTTGGHTGQETTLACKLTGTIVNGMRWLRPNSGTPDILMQCNSINVRCIWGSRITGYRYNADSSTQTIIVTIESFNPNTDAGDWLCSDGAQSVGQSICNKTVAYGPVPGSINFNSTASVEEGQDLTVDCTTDCNPPCDYSWTMGDNQITTSPLLNLTDISRNQDGNVYNCTATNIVILTSISKNFTLTVTCHVNQNASTSMEMVVFSK